MKKLISMLLLVSMLLSMAVIPASANETERDLTSREYTYINLEEVATSDPFASWKDVWNYGRFNTAIDTTKGIFDKVDYTYTDETEGEKTVNIWNYLPMTTYEGADITGEEPYYKKGFAKPGTTALSSYIYVAEDLLCEEGTEIKGYRYGAMAQNTAADAYTGKIERAEIKKAVSAAHVKERITEDEKNYAIIENNGIPHKIGPVNETQLSPNSVYLSNAEPVTVQIADEGANLSMLFTTTTINTKGITTSTKDTDKALNVFASPEAGLQQVTIKYADESQETKYVVVTNTAKSYTKNDIERIVVYAPKKTDDTEWVSADFVGENKKDFKFLTADNQAEHGVDVASVTSEDVKFENENILMTDTAAVARVVNNRMDASTSTYSNRANLATIKLQPKEITSIVFTKRLDFIGAPVETAIPIGTAATDLRQALVPVQIEGASEDYDYFAYVGALSDYTLLLGATLGEYSLQERIDILEDRMANVSSETESIEIDAEKADLIANTIVEESDFDADILAAYEIKKQEFAGQAAEEERQESLKERKYTYLDFAKDRDVFVNYDDAVDYGRFNTYAIEEGSATSRINEKYTYAEGIELFRYLPHITSDGTPVTGQEDYYFRGFQNSANTNLSAVGERGYVATSSYAYLTDSFFVADGTKLKGERVKASAGNTSKDYYEGTIQRTEEEKTITAPTVVKEIDENGYAVIKNGDVYSKIGPVSKTEIKGNAHRLGNSAGLKIDNVNTKGSSLDLVITSTGINYNSNGYATSKFATKAVPTAALQQVVINYKDGSYDIKKILVTNNASSSASDTAYRTIVFAPKYDDKGEKIAYNERSFYLDSSENSFTMVKKDNLSTIGLTSVEQINNDTVKFENEDIIYSSTGILATMIGNRMDIVNSNYGAYTNYASLPLQNKDIESISFPYNIDAALSETSAIIVSNEETSTVAPTICLLPIEIEGASDDYVYFAYCGRVAQDSYLMAATITEISAREKIDNAKEAISALTENSTIEEANKAKELFELACGAENVDVAKDFGDLATKLIDLYEVIREKTPLTSEVKLTFFNGEAPKATVTLTNKAQKAGKPYRAMMVYYGENGVMLDKEIAQGVSTEEETIKFEMGKEDFPEKTKLVKVLVWKDLSTILPLADVTVAEKTEKRIYMFVGASLVQGDHFTKPIELYYMTRFPYDPAEFYNKGRGGSTAASIMGRYDWDVQAQDATHAILIVGTNDIGYATYSDTNSELKEDKVNTAFTNIETLLGMMEKDYPSVTYMLPPIFDDRDYTGARAKYTGANAAMKKLGELAKPMAEKHGYTYIDNYAVTKTINEKPEIWNSGQVEMYSTDRVHPNAQGGYVMAHNIIKTLFPDSEVVAEVVVDAGNGNALAENAEVTDVNASKDSVKYTYKAKALPWTANDAYKKADGRYVALTDDLNREIIKVTGLDEGTYTLKMDGVTVGTYTNAEFAEGVNIATETYNPGQQQSGEVNKINESKHEYTAKIRGYALAKEALINAGAIDRVTGAIVDRTKFDATVKAKVDGKVYCYEYFDNYETYDKQYPTWVEECEKLTIKMREAAMPKAHTVEIIK